MAVLGTTAGRSDAIIVSVALAYTAVIGMSWPILEALVASGGPPAGLARRVALYNLVWPATGAAAMAIEGTILEWWPPGLMVGTAVIHLISGAWLALSGASAATADAHETGAGESAHAHPAAGAGTAAGADPGGIGSPAWHCRRPTSSSTGSCR